MRGLDFFQVVDSDRMVVTFAGKKDLDKVGDGAQLHQLGRVIFAGHRQRLVGRVLRLAAGDEIRPPDTFGHVGKWKVVEGMPHVTAGIAVLQSPSQDLVQSCSGNDSELTGPGDRARQSPIRDARAHSSLNDFRVMTH